MKKYLQNTRKHQFFTPELYKFIYGSECDNPKIFLIPLIVIHEGGDENFSAQVVIQDVRDFENNDYMVFLYSGNKLISVYSEYSRTAFPKIWSRHFGDICYMDWLLIQRKIQEKIGDSWKVDLSPEGKGFYFVTESFEALKAKEEAGQTYEIIYLPAEKESANELVNFALRMAGF